MLRKYSILAAGFLALVLGGLGGMVFFSRPKKGSSRNAVKPLSRVAAAPLAGRLP